MATPLNIYCVGLGQQFKYHYQALKNFTGNIQEIHFCDISSDRRMHLRKRLDEEKSFHQSPQIFSEFNQLLNLATQQKSATKEGVFIIATPINHHHDMAEQCLRKGFHVYIDKPFAMDYQEAKHLVDLAKEQKKLIVIGSQRRFEPIYQKIVYFAKSRIGKIQRIHFQNHGLFPKLTSHKSEGKILVGAGYHVLDTVVWLLQEILGSSKPLNLEHAILQKGNTFGETFVEAFFSHFIYKTDEIIFPVTASATTLTVKNSVDEQLVITGTNGEIKLIRIAAPRNMIPGVTKFIFWEKGVKEVFSIELNKKSDKAERGFPLTQLLKNVQQNTPENVKSTGKDALMTVKIIDAIKNNGKLI